jgi:hypothetical protein
MIHHRSVPVKRGSLCKPIPECDFCFLLLSERQLWPLMQITAGSPRLDKVDFKGLFNRYFRHFQRVCQ